MPANEIWPKWNEVHMNMTHVTSTTYQKPSALCHQLTKNQKQNAEIQNYRLFALITINPISSFGVPFVVLRYSSCFVVIF